MDKIAIIMSLLKDLEREMDMNALEEEEPVELEGVVDAPAEGTASKIADELGKEEEEPEEEF